MSLEIKRLQENYSFFETKLDEMKQNPDSYKIADTELELGDGESL